MTDAGMRTVHVYGHPVRLSIRPGSVDRTPLVLCNGIGASLEVLAPLVHAIDPAIEVITFDVPGVGGSPAPRAPYRFSNMHFCSPACCADWAVVRPTFSVSRGEADWPSSSHCSTRAGAGATSSRAPPPR